VQKDRTTKDRKRTETEYNNIVVSRKKPNYTGKCMYVWWQKNSNKASNWFGNQ